MNSAGFIYQDVLWFLAAVLPLAIVWSFLQRRRDARLARFAERATWTVVNRSVSPRARFHKALLLLLAVCFAIVAAARPYWGTREREVRKRGLNIILAVDVSTSMLATDSPTVIAGRGSSVAPTRLAEARHALKTLLGQSTGHRIGVMPFAGEPFLQCPLTTDYGIVNTVIDSVDLDSVGTQGTDIPAVIKAATAAFERSGEGKRVIVLITDGESHDESITDAAKEASGEGITIFAVGIGSQEGSPIMLGNGRFKEGPDGRKVITKLNPAILQDLAEQTGGGALISGEDGTVDIRPLARMIGQLEREELSADKRKIPEERYQWPLALALLCLFAEAAIGERRREDQRTKGGTA